MVSFSVCITRIFWRLFNPWILKIRVKIFSILLESLKRVHEHFVANSWCLQYSKKPEISHRDDFLSAQPHSEHWSPILFLKTCVPCIMTTSSLVAYEVWKILTNFHWWLIIPIFQIQHSHNSFQCLFMYLKLKDTHTERGRDRETRSKISHPPSHSKCTQ